MNKKFLGAVFIGGLLGLSFLNKMVWASDVDPAPYFDDCAEENVNDGDWSYGMGNNSAPGLGSTFYSSNDIFRTVRSSYYQCLCTGGSNSVQVNWWKVREDTTQATKDFYLSNGWTLAKGEDWHMPVAGDYMVKNFNYSCTSPIPSPTSAPNPTGSVTPTPTSVGSENNSSAVGGSGTGDPGAPVCGDSVLSAPIAVSVARSGRDAVDLGWTSVSEATDYMISYGLESGKYIYGVPSTGKVTSFRIGGLDLKKKYYFQVRAIKGCMPGTASNELSYPQSAIGGQVLGLAATNGIGMAVYAGIISGAAGIMIWLWRRYAMSQ